MGLLQRWEGRSIADWVALWEVPKVEIHRVLESTNDRLKRLAAAGAEAWTTVLAEEQTRGRGRGDRIWVSPPDVGLWMSLLLSGANPDRVSLLPIRVGLAVARVLEEWGGEGPDGERVMLKWPNDILVSRRKVGGILCETTGTGQVVVGIGLNVSQRPDELPPELREIASSLLEALGVSVPRGALAGDLIREIRARTTETSGSLQPWEVEAFGARDALLGHRVESETEGPGVALGITPRGSLILEAPGGRLSEVRSGSIKRIVK